MSWTPEGQPTIYYRAKDLTPTGRVRGGKDKTKPVATLQYLRGPGEGAFDVTIRGMKPGQTLRVLPQEGMATRSRSSFIVAGLEHMATTPALIRLNADDRTMWLIGFLAAKGVTSTVLHTDLGHRVR